MIRSQLIAVVMLVTGGVAVGACPTAAVRYSYSYPSYQSYSYVQPVYAAIPVVVPLYTASYYDPSAKALEELRREIQELRRERQQQAEPIPPPKPDDAEAAALVILKQHCATCHGAGIARGGLALFAADGKLAADINKGKVFRVAHKGIMPKGKPPLSDKEVDVLLEWLGK